MVLTVLIALVLAVLGIWGIFRGVAPGLLTLIGTLMGAALIDLWHARLDEFLRTWLGRSNHALWTWILTSLIFLAVAIVVGYGSGMLLARRADPNKPISIKERLMGGLVGVLDGALIVSYLLSYATTLLNKEQNRGILNMIKESQPAQILLQWLPWFVLAIVVTSAIAMAIQASYRLAKITVFASGRATAAPAERVAEPDAHTKSRHLQGVSDKIDQVLGERKRPR